MSRFKKFADKAQIMAEYIDLLKPGHFASDEKIEALIGRINAADSEADYVINDGIEFWIDEKTKIPCAFVTNSQGTTGYVRADKYDDIDEFRRIYTCDVYSSTFPGSEDFAYAIEIDRGAAFYKQLAALCKYLAAFILDQRQTAFCAGAAEDAEFERLIEDKGEEIDI